MPELSRFYGIIIRMFNIDNEHQAIMEIKTLNIIDGSLPKKARILSREWAELHQDELNEMWDTQNFHKISPLE